jgi:alkyl sulfatase BDS1-like metallo-beta-lactamase superfamily hydrolase
LNFDFLDEDVLVVKKKEPDWWTTYFDEAVNVYDNETGVMMISHNRNQYPILSSYSLSAPIL